jgi:hypothetical protein
MTLPLVFREKNPDGTTNSEWRLDDQPNGVGEPGADLIGDGSTYAPGGAITLQGGSYGCIEFDPLVPQTIPLPVGAVNTAVSFNTNDIYATMAADYTGFATSDSTSNGVDTLNTLTVQITGGSAGVGGLIISVDDNNGPTSDIRTGTIAQGATNTTVELTNFQLIRGINVAISGSTTGGTITFTLSRLQVATMTIKGSAISNFPPIAINSTPQSLDLSAMVNSSVHVTNCILAFSIANMPTNLKIDPTFTINYYDSYHNVLPNSTTRTLSFQNSSEAQVSLTLDPACSSMEFVISQVTLGAVDPNDPITINGNDTLTFGVRPQLTLQSDVQETDVSELDQDMIRDIAFKIRVTNNTRLGYEVNLYLSPNSVPTTDPNAVKLTFRIDPSPTAGQDQITDITTMKLTAQNIEYLTSSSTGKVYTQMEMADLSQGEIQPVPGTWPYLEVRASVTVGVLVNDTTNNQ